MATFEQLQEVRDLLEKSLGIINESRETKTYTNSDLASMSMTTYEVKEKLPDNQRALARDISRAYNNVRNMIWEQYKVDFDYSETL